jgi:hypothetical protein
MISVLCRYKNKQKKYVLGTYRYVLVGDSKGMYFQPQVRTFIMNLVPSTYSVHTYLRSTYSVRTCQLEKKVRTGMYFA